MMARKLTAVRDSQSVLVHTGSSLLPDTTIFHRLRRLPWDWKTIAFLLILVCLWGALLGSTWAHWGDLTIDCGREMYVPQVLAQGKTLYADVWFPYTPGAPYLNAILFRIFGVQLSVLYWAGALAALGCAFFLYLTSLEFGSRIAGWTTGVVVLFQAFVPGLFGFPLPYSFGAVYGCLGACVCLWLMIRAAASFRPLWMVAAGMMASITLLMKQEMGAACIGALAILVAARAVERRSFRTVLIDLISLAPGGLLSVSVIAWMVSIRGLQFVTQENISSWPTNYFMRTYGAAWLALTGLKITPGVFAKSTAWLLVATAIWLSYRWLLNRWGRHWWLVAAATAALVLALFVPPQARRLAAVAPSSLFPPAAPLLSLILAFVLAGLYWRNRRSAGLLQVLLLFAFSALLSLRILCLMAPAGYTIYYDGPVLLGFLVFLNWELSAPEGSVQLPARRAAALVPYIGAIAVVVLSLLPRYHQNDQLKPLKTARGVIYTTSQKAEAYRSVLTFMQQHRASGESFLSVPEDVSLYFLAGIRCPTRVYAFTPGVLAPGKMTADVIQQIERKQVRYLIWSNRTFPEYGVPKFGVDFDRPVGDYLRSAYRPVLKLGYPPNGIANEGDWTAEVWQRIQDPEVK